MLRALLLLGEPDKWKLTQQLVALPAGQAGGQALALMARSALVAGEKGPFLVAVESRLQYFVRHYKRDLFPLKATASPECCFR